MGEAAIVRVRAILVDTLNLNRRAQTLQRIRLSKKVLEAWIVKYQSRYQSPMFFSDVGIGNCLPIDAKPALSRWIAGGVAGGGRVNTHKQSTCEAKENPCARATRSANATRR